jgi:hypothetical protein
MPPSDDSTTELDAGEEASAGIDRPTFRLPVLSPHSSLGAISAGNRRRLTGDSYLQKSDDLGDKAVWPASFV